LATHKSGESVHLQEETKLKRKKSVSPKKGLHKIFWSKNIVSPKKGLHKIFWSKKIASSKKVFTQICPNIPGCNGRFYLTP